VKAAFADTALLSLAELEALAAEGEVEVVLVVAPDLQGRFTGKRYTTRGFLEHVLGQGAPICEYVLDRDVDMKPFQYAWERGFGDLFMRPDLATLRRAAWLERSAIVICDFVDADGELVEIAPRQVLRRQLERLAERGWSARVGTELEFLLFRASYSEARLAGYRDLPPATEYNTDCSTFGPTAVEDVVAPIRRALAGSGLCVMDSKGESHRGQIEINVRYAEAMRMADDHMIFKEAAKVVAAREGYALTFMPKYDEREGNSCHIHFSLWEGEEPLFAGAGGDRAAAFGGFLAGQLRHSRELAWFFAPNVNSYKRFADRSFAPVSVVWGEDNRTCGLRALGRGPSLRVESRFAGGDCNPYLAIAAIAAMGLAGIEAGAELEAPFAGDAYELGDERRLPLNLMESLELLRDSAFARESFGEEVVEYLLAAGWSEQREYDAAVTDWELHRSFERL
jgi:glutamine synthetase